MIIKLLQPAILLIAICLSFQNFGWSQEGYADSLKKVVQTQNGKARVLTLNELAYTLHRSSTSEALKFGEEALTLARKLNDSSLLALTLNDAVLPLLISGDFDKALNYTEEILLIRERFPDSLKTATALAKMGHIYQELAQYDKALTYYGQAEELLALLHAEHQQFQLKSNIANIFQELGRLDEAILMEQEILDYARKINDPYTLCNVLNNIGTAYRKKGDFEMANALYAEMIQIAEENDYLEAKAVAYQSMGVNFREIGETEKGSQFYQKALQLYKKIASKPGISYMYYNLGLAYIDLNLLDSAATYLHQCIDLSREMKSFRQLKNAFIGLSQLAKAQNNFPLALSYKDSVLHYYELTFTNEGNTLVAEMFQKYQLAERERELLAQDLALVESKRNVNNLIFLLVVSGLVGGAIFFRLRLRQKQLKTEMQLQSEIEQRKLQERLHQERMRISRDLHDSLGAELTLISSSADNFGYEAAEKNQKAFEEIGAISRNAMRLLRDTIWAIRNDQIDMEAFIIKLNEFISHRKTLLNFEIKDQLRQPITLSPNQGLHLFRICQEAIQNTIKHAGAASVVITFSTIKEKLIIELKDNGLGFEQASTKGYGLKNMQERIKEINGSITIQSDVGKGTTIRIEIPFK